ncbi:hypothetical protein HNQ96_003836 [Aminobacter lissarensis]|uniref:Uncharacterized protein n=1 Tax=Aminobacter carboxidus TaxID=376165 RepID=A0A8E1WH89_9HYPH|nr:hypothetical protein [Aminobacter lissarensis]
MRSHANWTGSKRPHGSHLPIDALLGEVQVLPRDDKLSVLCSEKIEKMALKPAHY